MNDIAWLMCECNIWPTYMWSTFGYYSHGRCGRCHSEAKLLSGVKSRSEARSIFAEKYGALPWEGFRN
jgi:hypothetical protein